MQPISNLLERFRKVKPFPDDSMCPTCHWVLPGHPVAARMLAERGYDDGNLHLVACRCPLLQRQASRDELRRWDFAELPRNHALGGNPATFANFGKRAGADLALEAARAFARGDGPAILVLAGIVGTGKTHLLCAIGRVCLAQGRKVKYGYVPDLLERLRASFSGELTGEAILDEYRSADILLLDDVGKESPTAWTGEKITSLVDERYRNGRRLAVATNLANRDEANTPLRSRLFDTQTGHVEVVILACDDYRRQEKA